nr:hypothetical protein 23 [bacterium]BDD47930.1 hypothetical protein 4 [bacterium]
MTTQDAAKESSEALVSPQAPKRSLGTRTWDFVKQGSAGLTFVLGVLTSALAFSYSAGEKNARAEFVAQELQRLKGVDQERKEQKELAIALRRELELLKADIAKQQVRSEAQVQQWELRLREKDRELSEAQTQLSGLAKCSYFRDVASASQREFEGSTAIRVIGENGRVQTEEEIRARSQYQEDLERYARCLSNVSR